MWSTKVMSAALILIPVPKHFLYHSANSGSKFMLNNIGCILIWGHYINPCVSSLPIFFGAIPMSNFLNKLIYFSSILAHLVTWLDPWNAIKDFTKSIKDICVPIFLVLFFSITSNYVDNVQTWSFPTKSNLLLRQHRPFLNFLSFRKELQMIWPL